MKKIISWFRTPAVSILAFVAAFGLIALSGIGIARAVPSIRTDNEYTNIAHESIGVALLENGKMTKANNQKLLGSLLEQTDGKLVLNYPSSEPLSVQNTGAIDEYVRVTVRKYWLDSDGKQTDLSPDLIQVKLGGKDIYDAAFTGGNNWVKDSRVSTEEQVVLYYSQKLASGSPTGLFADSIQIDNSIATEMWQDPPQGNTIITHYKYNGVQFCLEATVDAVQDHNAYYTNENGNVVGAIKSAWGVDAPAVGINVG